MAAETSPHGSPPTEPNPATDAADAAEEAARGDLPAALIKAIGLVGDPEAAKERIQAYRDAGADLPVVYPVPALEPVSSMTGTILALAPHPALEA